MSRIGGEGEEYVQRIEMQRTLGVSEMRLAQFLGKT